MIDMHMGHNQRSNRLQLKLDSLHRIDGIIDSVIARRLPDVHRFEAGIAPLKQAAVN